MADPEGSRRPRRPRGTQTAPTEDFGPAPPEVHPSIAGLRGAHRAAHPDTVSILEASSHLLMLKEWPVTCPRMLEALKEAGTDCCSQLKFIRLDHHLLTALVERWSPQTNTFHLPVGELTITLEDVSMILGLHIDGPALVGHNIVGFGRRWQSWPDCCDDLLGSHPDEDTVYHDPVEPRLTAKFRMGQAAARTCLPLRWLRWQFCRDSYVDLPDITFRRHVRAYILFLIGSFLLPDTSGSEVHLQYLTLLEDLEIFTTYSLGGAVLAHLYRELSEATKPRRVNMAGCLHLLQVWLWERIHVGRPTLLVPTTAILNGRSVGVRWNEQFVREMPMGNLALYRNEFDGLIESQVTWEPYTDDIKNIVDGICLTGQEIWTARVPLICWKRVEWHLPDRVMRQFGFHPRVDMEPMDPNFKRVDGRGKADVDWVQYHQTSIALWEARRGSVIPGRVGNNGRESAIRRYMRWFRSWATLYMLKAAVEPPETYYQRAPAERLMGEYILESDALLRPFYGQPVDSPMQQAVNRVGELCTELRRQVHITDRRYEDVPEEDTSSASAAHQATSTFDVGGSSSYTEAGPSTSYRWDYPSQVSQFAHAQSQFEEWPQWGAPHGSTASPFMIQWPAMHTGGQEHTPAGAHDDWVTYQDASQPTPTEPSPAMPPTQESVSMLQHQLRERPRRGPDHYTPGTDAIPRRKHRRARRE